MRLSRLFKWILVFSLLFSTTNLFAGLDELINCTCRVEVPTQEVMQNGLQKYIYGTGFVFKEDNSDYYIMTAGHITIEEVKSGLYLRFFHGQQESAQIHGEVYKEVCERNTTNDLAVIKMRKIDLANYPKPTLIKISKDQTAGKIFYTFGCPNGNWPSGYRGHLTETIDMPGSLGFYPMGEHGQSGSAITMNDEVVGIILALNTDKRIGSAAPLKKIKEWLTRWKINY